MRFGDLEVTLIPLDGGQLIERDDQTVLARPGQVYGVRIANHAPGHRAVVTVAIDGLPVSEDGVLLDPAGYPGGTVVLERPTARGETGRFTFVPEGDEDVFGEGGGRDNPELGLVRAEHRRELAPYRPPVRQSVVVPPVRPSSPGGRSERDVFDMSSDEGEARAYSVDLPPPESAAAMPRLVGRLLEGRRASTLRPGAPRPSAPARPAPSASPAPVPADPASVEGAGGTGLTGHSLQEFVDVTVGPLERAPTVVMLRLVLGTPNAFGPRPLPGRLPRETAVPPRPAPRP